MIPITKNIIVVDEFGTEYEPTYLKRAKGLVKNGRARFISDNRICLTRPPDFSNFLIENTEETSVDNNINYNAAVDTASAKNESVTVESILARIDKIIEDTSYISGVLSRFNGSANVPNGIQQVVQARETTNQRMIDFLERIYNDIKPLREEDSTEPENMRAFKMFLDAMGNFDADELDFAEILVGGPGTGGGALRYFFGKDSIFNNVEVPHNVHLYGQQTPNWAPNWNQNQARPARPAKQSKPPKPARGWANGFGNNVTEAVNKAMEGFGQMGNMFNQPPFDDNDDDDEGGDE